MSQQLYQKLLQQSLNSVKKRLGGDCLHLSFEQSKDEKTKEPLLCFKACIKNDAGGKDTVRYKILGGLEEITNRDFETLFENLNSKAYLKIQ